MTEGKPKQSDWAGWAGVLVTAVIALVAITVQWGVVTTKLDHLEKRLDEMIFESRSIRDQYQSIERRLATLEGQHQAQGQLQGVPHEQTLAGQCGCGGIPGRGTERAWPDPQRGDGPAAAGAGR